MELMSGFHCKPRCPEGRHKCLLSDARHIAQTKTQSPFPSPAARAGCATPKKTTQAVAFFLYLPGSRPLPETGRRAEPSHRRSGTPMNRLSAVTDQAGRVTRYEYDPVGALLKAVNGNGTETSYGYDALYRLREVVNRKTGGAVITSHRYTLDAAGFRTQIEENDSTVQYTYDKLYRLTEEHRTGNIAYDAAYTYDSVGNRLTKTATDGNYTYTYDANDRLLSDGKYTCAWDDASRMTGKTGPEGTTSYLYDQEDKLVETSGPNGWARYTYDALGNRIGKSTASGNTSFLIDPNMPYAQVLEETTGGVAKVYAYGLGLINAQGPEGTSWFARDGLGSTRALTDANGTLTDAYTYEAFGQTVAQTGGTENQFLFAGEWFDESLGFYYLRARYYDPANGRFTAMDPFQGYLSAPLSLHKYVYCNDSPVNYTDPSGNFTTAEVVCTSAIVGILAGLATFYYTKNVGLSMAVGVAAAVVAIVAMKALTAIMLGSLTYYIIGCSLVPIFYGVL